MQPCPLCDTNCHTPTFSAQGVRRLTRARPAFSRSILSHGIVLNFLIVVPSHVECKAPTRLTLQRIFSTLLLFGTSHVPLSALVTDSRTTLITIASQAYCLTLQVQFLWSTNCLSNLFSYCLKVRISMALSACSLCSPPRPARYPCITLTSCLHKGVSNIVLALRLRVRALLLRSYRPRLITRRNASEAISITRHHLVHLSAHKH